MTRVVNNLSLDANKPLQTTYQRPDGATISNGQTIIVDHEVDTFIITVKSMSGVQEQTLKNLIQQQFEVVEIDHDKRVIVSQN